MRKFFLSIALAVLLVGVVGVSNADAQWRRGRRYYDNYPVYVNPAPAPSYSYYYTPDAGASYAAPGYYDTGGAYYYPRYYRRGWRR
jgi:hypothetical protein